MHFLQRIAAYVLDWPLTILITAGVYTAFFLLTQDLYPLDFDGGGLGGVFLGIGLSFAIILGIPALPIILHACFLARFGATPGKMLLGLKVTRADGAYLSFGRAAGRTLALLTLSNGLTGGIGYLTVLFDKQDRALHDILADSRVGKPEACCT